MDKDQNSRTDHLLKTSPKASVELSEDQLDAVAGGETVPQGVSNNKNKGATKSADTVDGYIRS